jgi:hypothetical protein
MLRVCSDWPNLRLPEHFMRSPTGPSPGSPRGAAVLAITESELLHNRLLNLFLAITVLGLVAVWVYLTPLGL